MWKKILEGEEKIEKMKRVIDLLTKECLKRDSATFLSCERQANSRAYESESFDNFVSVWDGEISKSTTIHDAVADMAQSSTIPANPPGWAPIEPLSLLGQPQLATAACRNNRLPGQAVAVL